MYKDEFMIGGNLENVLVEYEYFFKVVREIGCLVNRVLLNYLLFFFVVLLKV